MKISKLLILSLFVFNCGSNRYFLNDINKTDKRHITQFISTKIKAEEIGKKPLIVIDGKPFTHNHKLNLSKENIEKIDIISKKPGLGKLIWREHASDGVVLIMTNLVAQKEPKDANDSDIMFFIDGIQVDASKIETINNNDIQTIQVFKSNNKFLLFDGTELDGFIFITMK